MGLCPLFTFKPTNDIHPRLYTYKNYNSVKWLRLNFFFFFQKAIISAGMTASFNFYIEAMHHSIHLRLDCSLAALSVISLLHLFTNSKSALIRDKRFSSWLSHSEVWWPPNRRCCCWLTFGALPPSEAISFPHCNAASIVPPRPTLSLLTPTALRISSSNYLFAKQMLSAVFP